MKGVGFSFLLSLDPKVVLFTKKDTPVLMLKTDQESP